MSDKPLISLVLVSYNQEQYIREAVASALSQTYSPLEIVLSDDCSKDRTFEIMQEMAAAYCGPHKIILNRNTPNLGLCGNLNRAVVLSSGELIVAAAGDDVSLPHRCARLVEEWVKPGRRWHSIVSDAEIIDDAGRTCGIYQNIQSPRRLDSVERALEVGVVNVAGCCHAFSRANYEAFGPIDPKAPGEDEILGFRSVLMGGILWVPDILVSYRRHEKNLFKDANALRKMSPAQRRKAIAEDEMACALRHRLYVEYINMAAAKNILTHSQAGRYLRLLNYRRPYYECRFVFKYSFGFSVAWILWQALCAKYRRGMFTMFRLNHFPYGIRTTLIRRWRERFGRGAAA